jgi:signal transduction histidine kinase
MKSPMNAVLGLNQLLLNAMIADGAPERWITMARGVHNAAGSVLSLIEDLHAMAKIEAGGEPVELADATTLAADLAETVAVFAAEADARKVALTLEIDTSLPTVRWDIRRIRLHVLNNLISNALKFTPTGGTITLTASSNGNAVILTLADTGPGVPAAVRERIFHRFAQSDDNAARAFGGSGLGLHNAKRYVELHGGVIRVEDNPAGGALFVLLLPTHLPENK